MADWFVDTVLATGGNDGTTMDDAWQSIETAMEYNGFAAGDKIWIRRRSSHTLSASDITLAETAQTAGSPLEFIGWPRRELSGTDGGAINFTNGSNVLDGAATITPDLEKHVCRRLKNDTDGNWYLITAIATKVVFDNPQTTDPLELGMTIHGDTSGAVGKIHKVDEATSSVWVVLRDPGTTFSDGENIDNESGDTYLADVNGAPTTDGFVIDRDYAGSTASSADYSIQADDDYTEAQAIDDAAWTIKVSDWNADNEDLPTIDCGGNAYQIVLSASIDWVKFKNLLIKDTTDYGVIDTNGPAAFSLIGSIIQQPQNERAMRPRTGMVYFERVIVQCWGSAANNRCMYGDIGILHFKDCALYGAYDDIFYCSAGTHLFHNVNLGVEVEVYGGAAYDDISTYHGVLIKGYDVKFGGGGGGLEVQFHAGGPPTDRVTVENYNKVLGAHRSWVPAGYIAKLDVVEGSGDPEKRSGGADSVVHVKFDRQSTWANMDEDWAPHIFVHEFEATTDSKSYRYYVQNDGELAAGNLRLVAEYVDGYDSATEYHTTTKEGVYSNTPMPARAGASDWGEYIEVTAVQPAIASKVRITLYCNYYHATNDIYIDPKVVIT